MAHMAEKPSEAKELEITFPDGAVKTFSSGVTGLEIAESISKSLAKASVAVKLDDQLWDLTRPIKQNARIEIVKRDSDEGLELLRHDCAHVMAQAVQELFPGTQVTIGPVIEHGFFYDFAREEPFSTDDFEAIEKRMREIVDRGDAFERQVWDRDEAIAYFKEQGELFKAEIIEDLPADEEVSVYKQGEWLDLCRGPHMPTTKHIGKAFKLTKVAGAYWRGDSNNQMLTRIYGTAWAD